MLLQPAPVPWLKVERAGAATVVRLARASMLEDEAVALVRETLFDLVDRQGQRLVVLNFGRTVGLTSRMLGQVVALHKKLQASGGRLVLCGVSPFLDEVFQTVEVPGALCILDGEDEALQAVASAP